MSRWSRSYTDPYDDSADFVHAISLLAALEGCTNAVGWQLALPYLGMARSELVEFGQRRPRRFTDITVDDYAARMLELTGNVGAMLIASNDLRRSVRLQTALDYLLEATRAVIPDLGFVGLHPD